MKIFHKDDKVNFVDVNNVLLGYDMFQSCCEHADWFIADTPRDPSDDGPFFHVEDNGLPVPGLDEYVFDTGYYNSIGGDEFDGGAAVIFRITNGTSEKFLHLFNVHNGYYSHGFDLSVGGHILRRDSL